MTEYGMDVSEIKLRQRKTMNYELHARRPHGDLSQLNDGLTRFPQAAE